MRSIRFQLAIPRADYLRFYQGQARKVAVLGEDGSRIQFPAEHLRAYVMHDGIHGRFELQFDEDNRFVALRKI